MLRNIPLILSPDVLWTLRAMGHGDELVIADSNFRATALGARCHRLDGLTATDVLKAVLTVLPLNRHVENLARVMEVVDDPDSVPPVKAEFQNITTITADSPVILDKLERLSFYDLAQAVFAIIQTGETRLYGNIILKKGVIST